MPNWITIRYIGNDCKECGATLKKGDRAVIDEGALYCASCGEEVAGQPDPEGE